MDKGKDMSSKVRMLINKLQSGDINAGIKAAEHHDAESSQLEELSHSPHVEVRISSAKNPNLSVETITRLAYDPDVRVAVAIAERNNLTKEIYDALTKRVTADYISHKGKEKFYVFDLAVALIDSKNATIEEAEYLLKNISTSHLPRLLAEKTKNIKVQQFISNHPKMTVRLACLENENLEREIIEKLINDTNQKVSEKAITLFEEKFADEQQRTYEELNNEFELFINEFSVNSGIYKKECEFDNEEIYIDKLKNDNKVLLIGSCDGQLAENIAKKYQCKITALNTSAELTQQFQNNNNKETLNWNYFPPAQQLPFPKNTFDYLIIEDFLQLRTPATELLPELISILENNSFVRGKILCIDSDVPEAFEFMSIASSFGFNFEDRHETEMHLATSGLVIETISKFKLIKNLFNIPYKSSANDLWVKTIDEYTSHTTLQENTVLGFIEIKGKKLNIG